LTTGAANLVKTLEEFGVEITFGMPGSHLLDLMDAISSSKIKNVLVTSELSGAFMADGYSRATGKIGVSIAIPGPGLTNMITGLAEAYLDSSPIVVVVIGIVEDGKSYHIHQIEQLETVRPVVKGVIKIRSSAEIPQAVHRAFQSAEQGEPGPVVVEVDNQILRESVKIDPYRGTTGEKELSGESCEKLKEIAEAMLKADQLGIYAGKGAFTASEHLKRIAELLFAPVATTVSGKGVIPEDHELAVGFGFGPVGSDIAEDVFKKCDVILAIGCKFSELSTGKWSMEMPQKLIHIDKEEETLNRNYPASITLCEDAARAAKKILEHLKDRKKEGNQKIIDKIARYKERHLETARKKGEGQGVHPSRFFYLLANIFGGETITVTDCGNHQLWAISDCRALKPGTFITPSDYQSMGFGIPAAVGACIGCPSKKVICISGDGGFVITGFEMLTAVREKLDLAVFIFNDGALGLMESMQKRFYGRTESVTLQNPDFEKLAGAFGVKYIEMNNDDDLDAGLREIKENKGVFLANVQIKYDEWPKYLDGMTAAAWRRLSLQKKLGLVAKRALRLLKLA
jgi:acetolactate synthase-1/2/3 large subunit